MKKILVATDFSERSDRALRRAALLARQFDASILLVHVVDDDQPRRIVGAEQDQATELLRQAAETLRNTEGIACDTRVILAAPFVGIAQAVADLKTDLLVIGPHRRHVLKDAFIGTTAERTIKSVTCPVLMTNAPPVGPYRHILQTTDLSDGSRDALLRFSALGLGGQAHNSLVHVFDAPALRLVFGKSIPQDTQQGYLEGEQRNAAHALAAFAASAGLEGIPRILRHEATAAPHEILKAAETEKADLIVLSTHSRKGIAKLLIGSVTTQVLRAAPVDVLAIPPAGAVGVGGP